MQREAKPWREASVAGWADLDWREADAAFVAALVERGCARGEVLALGAGSPAVALALAGRCPELALTVADLSSALLDQARLRVAHAGQSRSIRLLAVDLGALPFGSAQFDGVYCDTLLHRVDDPVAVLRELTRVARSTATLVVRDLLRPDTTAACEALVARHAGGAGEVAVKQLFASLRAAYTLDEARALLTAAGLADTRFAMTSDCHFTMWITPR